MVDLLKLFEEDDETDAVLLIGEIGGTMEIAAAEYAAKHCTKPVFSFIAGRTAPPGRRMGHAGAIVSGQDESAKAKMERMAELGDHGDRVACHYGDGRQSCPWLECH